MNLSAAALLSRWMAGMVAKMTSRRWGAHSLRLTDFWPQNWRYPTWRNRALPGPEGPGLRRGRGSNAV